MEDTIFFFQIAKTRGSSIKNTFMEKLQSRIFKFKPQHLVLNFVDDKNQQTKNFMLLCGFESFDKFFVRIDILERLFVQIINTNKENNKDIKLIPEMLNLLGCNKDNFY